MTANTIKQKTVRGILWNSIEKFLVKGSSFIISIILARILSPSDYGLIGMLAVFISLSNVFIESGLSKALIQKQNCTDTDYSTAFYTNIIISIVIYVILYFAAPYVAKFYHEPQLCAILRVLSVNFVLGSLNVVQRTKLMSRMDFRSLAFVNFIGTVSGGIIGIIMAYSGCGVWSLVGQSIAVTFATIIFFPIYSKWRPQMQFSRQSFNQLFKFGSKLLISGTVATVVNNISTIAIGNIYRTSQLGFYTRASQFSEMVAFTVNDVMGTVTFPALSELQNNTDRMIAVYKKSLYFTAFIIFPVMTMMALLAKPLVLLLLTEKWLPCVALMQLLCIARMFTPLSAINMNLLNAIGRSDLFMKVDLSKIPIILVSLAITIPISVKAICIGNLVTTIICFFINTYYPGKMFGYGASEQIKDYWKLFVAIILMSFVIYVVCMLIINIWIQIFVGVIVGCGVYFISCLFLKAVTIKEIKSVFNVK